jgi:catechol 2,3-dioxygenase-like lactoylglutathione lyase family enzyme
VLTPYAVRWPTMTASEGVATSLVPELDVTDLNESLRFYLDVLGFSVVFERRAERFVYLAREGAEIMLQEAGGPGRRFRTAPLERPFGRGVNLQIAVGDVDAILASVARSGVEPVVPLEERWYDVEVTTRSGRWRARGPVRAGNRQFVVADPDGYLLRIFTSLGVQPA